MVSQTFSLKREQNDLENDVFKSRAILQTKKNYLETHQKDQSRRMNSSTFSLNKKFNTMEVENHEEFDEKRSTSLGISKNISPIKSRGKVKLRELKDLKELRGTLNMPRV